MTKAGVLHANPHPEERPSGRVSKVRRRPKRPAMRFDLVDLQLFVAVADTGSITHGAARASLALASASARIKGLEADLGVTLMRRRRRGIELTAAGESLRDHARAI